jgi:hypothetical protein
VVADQGFLEVELEVACGAIVRARGCRGRVAGITSGGGVKAGRAALGAAIDLQEVTRGAPVVHLVTGLVDLPDARCAPVPTTQAGMGIEYGYRLTLYRLSRRHVRLSCLPAGWLAGEKEITQPV